MDEDNSAENDNVCESQRLLQMRISFRTLFKIVASGVSLARFQELYAETLEKSLSSKLHKILMDTMANEMIKEFDEFIMEDKVDEKFKALSKIIEENPVSKDIKAWRPTGDCLEQLKSYDVENKLKMNRDLETLCNNEEVEIQLLQQEILPKRYMARDLKERMIALTCKLHSEAINFTEMNTELEKLLPAAVEWNVVLDS